jgi:hypothetical protein
MLCKENAINKGGFVEKMKDKSGVFF